MAYRNILLNSRKALREILAHLRYNSTSHLPIVIHCTAGKDRTGVIVMVLLLLAGCSKDEIAKEYHLTEAGLGPAWREDAVQRLQGHPVFQNREVEAIERMVGARQEVMKAVIRMVETEFGGVEKLLTTNLGIDHGTLEACKKLLRQKKTSNLEGKIIVDAKLAKAAGMRGL